MQEVLHTSCVECDARNHEENNEVFFIIISLMKFSFAIIFGHIHGGRMLCFVIILFCMRVIPDFCFLVGKS